MPLSPPKVNWRSLSEQVAEKSLFLLVFILPLAFIPGVYWPFDTPKVALLRLVTIVMLGAWMTRALAFREFKVVYPPASLPVLAYLGVFTLTSLTSISPTLSFLGEGARNDGLLTIANLVLLYFLVPNVLGSAEKLKVCVRLLILSGGVVSILGIIQYFFIFSPHWAAPVGGRASSTLSNPDFLFSYLVLLIPFTAGFALRQKKYALLLLPMLACIVLTLPSAGRPTSPGRSPEVLIEPATILKTAPGTIESSLNLRWQDWMTVLQTIKDRPILGSGPNTLKHTFTRYQTVAQTDPNIRVDKAHNEFLEAASTMGLVGLGVYLWMLLALGWLLFQGFRHSWGSPAAWLAGGTLAAFLLYVGQSLMVFHTVAAYLTFWLILAIGLGLTQGKRFRSFTVRWDKSPSFPLWKKGIKGDFGGLVSVIFRIFGAFIVLLAGYLAIRPLVADIYFLKAENLKASTRTEVLEKLLLGDKVLQYNGYEPLYVTTYIIDLAEASNYTSEPEFKARLLSRAVEQAGAAIRASPNDANLYFARALVRYLGEPAARTAIISDLGKALELYPNYFQANLMLAELEKRRGHYQQAIAARQVALRVLPGHGRAVFALGDDYYSAGEPQKAIDAWERAKSIIPREPLVYLALGKAYEERGDKASARQNYETAFRLKPTQPGLSEALERLK